ncbi:MAG: FtsX-like permease family protein, partial [Verrucomicrobiota bacterium]|nr:FtsX-like permease family protein [Verrucomicrobiota bacterium]
LGMGVLLLNLIPQFHYSLEQELGSEANESKLPKLFLFDIQENQLQDLEETLRLSGKPLLNRTPWVRGRLLSVKGINYEDLVEKDRDFQNPGDQRRNRLRNRGFNLSYRDRLLESEEILRGRMVRMTFDRSGGEPAEISVEHKYAESLGVDLGDRMEIEVSGVPIEAEVVNLRRVKWTTFQPNFFVQMQPGVLESAPKTFIGTLNDLDPNEKEVIQDLLVRKFPTISILDVERTGRKILEIVSQMTWILQVMATLSVLAGLIVLYSLALEKARRQKWELALLKILGASFSDLRCQIRIEFGLLALTAASLGVSLSLATSYLLAEQVFDRVWSFHLAMPLLSVLTVTLLSLLTAELATGKILKAKPSSLIFENK